MVSFGIQIALVGVAILIPLLVYDQLPKTQLTSFLVAPPPPPPPPPPPAAVVQKVARVIPRQFDAGRLMAPKAIPKKVIEIQEEELPPASGVGGVVGGVPGGVPGGSPGGVIGGIIGSVPTAAPPPPPPVKVVEKPKEVQRIRVGGNVQQANLIRRIPLFTRRWRSRRAFRAQFASRRSSPRTARFRICSLSAGTRCWCLPRRTRSSSGSIVRPSSMESRSRSSLRLT